MNEYLAWIDQCFLYQIFIMGVFSLIFILIFFNWKPMLKYWIWIYVGCVNIMFFWSVYTRASMQSLQFHVMDNLKQSLVQDSCKKDDILEILEQYSQDCQEQSGIALFSLSFRMMNYRFELQKKEQGIPNQMDRSILEKD